MKIIFMGTPEFGAIILEGLCQSEYKPILVITAPDKPAGRKQIITFLPVKIVAQKYNIPVSQPISLKNSSCVDFLIEKGPDLIVVAAYGQILPKEILEIPQYGCLNVHPSLLPKYRGSSPIQYTILNGDKETGVTIILMDEKMDHGPILAARELEFSIFNYPSEARVGDEGEAFSDLQFSNLHDKLADLGAKLLIETIPKWLAREIKPKPQDDSKATYTKILKKEDGKIDWKKSAEEIERQIRAFELWPGSFTIWEKIKNKEPLKIKI